MLIIGGLILALLNTFIKPALKTVGAPFVWITFGLFVIVIHMSFLWLADYLLPQLVISDLYSLILSSLIMTLVNAFM